MWKGRGEVVVGGREKSWESEGRKGGEREGREGREEREEEDEGMRGCGGEEGRTE